MNSQCPTPGSSSTPVLPAIATDTEHETNGVNVRSRGVLSMPPAALCMEHSAGVRMGRELLEATRPFASEIKQKSQWCVVSTSVLTITILDGAGLATWWPKSISAGQSRAGCESNLQSPRRQPTKS
jgi:hypothetical protein